MASTTEQPRDPVPRTEETEGEMEPLIGLRGGATQGQGQSMFKNTFMGKSRQLPIPCGLANSQHWILLASCHRAYRHAANKGLGEGTGFIAQFGIILTFILVWVSLFRTDIILFSAHPMLQTTGILAVVQSILVLQPTHTKEQKLQGQTVHALLHLVSFVTLCAGVIVIEYNKFSNGLSHFLSPHAYIGVITSVVIALQYLVGFTMWATPALYGGEARARSVWKYHRWSGYLVLVLLMASVISAAKTNFMENVVHMSFPGVAVGCILVLVGVIPRVKKEKLGLRS
jgi:cytochrome b-561